MNAVELLGYVAMFLIGVSFLMRDMLKLRLMNFIGAMLFVIYGFLIESFPVMMLNIFITLVNAYHIFKLLRTGE